MRRPPRHIQQPITRRRSPAPQQPARRGSVASRSSDDLWRMADWMAYHEQTLVPARIRGGAEEVRQVLLQARSEGLIHLTAAELEQEIRDVMYAPITEPA